jgi:NAD-dependent deacetylase
MNELRAQFTAWWKLHGCPHPRVAVLTGAGISAESGVPTFRGSDGLWRGRAPAELFTPDALREEPRQAWELYEALRARMAAASPNAGHMALAALEAHLPVTVITQNIDGLHQRAGSRQVLEIHGTLWRMRCEGCSLIADEITVPLPHLPPICPLCAQTMRPDIVLFSEALPATPYATAIQATAACDLMLVVGTSGVVYPAAGLPLMAAQHGARVVEINPEATALTPQVALTLRASAAAALPVVVGVLAGG